jgi:hypothetical protein
LHTLQNFFAVDRHLGGRFNANPDAIAPRFDNRDDDVPSDHDPLPFLAAQN